MSVLGDVSYPVMAFPFLLSVVLLEPVTGGWAAWACPLMILALLLPASLLSSSTLWERS